MSTNVSASEQSYEMQELQNTFSFDPSNAAQRASLVALLLFLVHQQRVHYSYQMLVGTRSKYHNLGVCWARRQERAKTGNSL